MRRNAFAGVAAHSRLHKWRNGRIKPVARLCIPQRERAEIAECLLELLAARSQLCHPAAVLPAARRTPRANGPTICKRSRNERDRPCFSSFIYFLFFSFAIFSLSLFLSFLFFSFLQLIDRLPVTPQTPATHPNFPAARNLLCPIRRLDDRRPSIAAGKPAPIVGEFFSKSSRVVPAYGVARERRIESVSLRIGRCGFVKRDSLGRCFVRV